MASKSNISIITLPENGLDSPNVRAENIRLDKKARLNHVLAAGNKL